MAPSVIREPENHGDLLAEGPLVRKRYQKRWDFARIMSTIPNKTTNLTNWWTRLTLWCSEERRKELI